MSAIDQPQHFVHHTSSRFDCFALLALNEVEASLGALSSFGRGMLDGLSEKALGGLPFGVPLYVPAADIAE